MADKIQTVVIDCSDPEAEPQFIFVDAPPPVPPQPFTIFKADIWRRCTDTEATQLDAAISQQPVRLRRMFDDAQLLRSDDELFHQIEAAVVALLGAERAAVVLKASEAE